MKPTIGFVGLGTMGKWMAINLVKKGFPLNFFARKKEVIEMMRGEGGKYVPSLKGLARESDWLVFCLSDTEAVEEVLFGKDGMAEELKPGKIVIDCGTIHPLPTRRFAETLKGERGAFPGRADFGNGSPRQGRDPDDHGGRRKGNFRRRPGPSSRPWATKSSTPASPETASS